MPNAIIFKKRAHNISVAGCDFMHPSQNENKLAHRGLMVPRIKAG
jgi:hypothetical protein